MLRKRTFIVAQTFTSARDEADGRRPSLRCRAALRRNSAASVIMWGAHEQLDLQALHRVRYRLVGQRTAIINQIRGFLLEHGITVRQRIHWLRHALANILSTPLGDPGMTEWMKTLKSKDGGLCCSGHDGVVLSEPNWKSENGHYSVRLDGRWINVPDNAVVEQPNRFGPALVWPVKGAQRTDVLSPRMVCILEKKSNSCPAWRQFRGNVDRDKVVDLFCCRTRDCRLS